LGETERERDRGKISISRKQRNNTFLSPLLFRAAFFLLLTPSNSLSVSLEVYLDTFCAKLWTASTSTVSEPGEIPRS
jgi:hypothetical protein